MELAVGAKNTKPGSKANARGAGRLAGAKPARVPVGTLHRIDPAAQSRMSASYDALCGETGLMIVDDEWDGDCPNERCPPCTDSVWAKEFEEQQRKLLG